ncbi:MAG: zinc ribbon domain-containing protein [Dehalococcoidia bacterium]
MPIYQYDCAGCSRRVDVFFRSAGTASKPTCPECGGKKLTRVMSQFVRARSEADRLDSIDVDAQLGKLGGSDTGDFARWSKRLGKELGDDLGGDFREFAERAQAGDDPVERVDPGFTLKTRIEKRRSEASGDASTT